MINLEREKILSKAVKELLMEYPFYGYFMLGLRKIWDDKIPTMGVRIRNGNHELIINEEFFLAQTQSDQIALLLHELMHICLFHTTDVFNFPDKQLANIAMDEEINGYLDPRNPQNKPVVKLSPEIMENAATVPNINKTLKLNQEFNLGTNEYYKNLINSASASKMSQAFSSGASSYSEGDGETIDKPNHDWEIVDEDGNPVANTRAAKQVAKQQVEAMLQQAEEATLKSQGTVPGEMAELLKSLKEVKPQKFNWRGYVRRFVGKSEMRFTKTSKFKPNHRFPGFPGLKFKEKVSILLAIDTSGSVSTKELLEFQNEMMHLLRLDIAITVIQCDTVIRSIKPLKKNEDIVIHGRGGTAFNPVIDFYNENISKYSCLIYLTDGECSCDVKPQGATLWVHSERSTINQSLPGHKIRLEL